MTLNVFCYILYIYSEALISLVNFHVTAETDACFEFYNDIVVF